MILKQYNSNFVTHELLPGFCTIKDLSEAVYTMGDHEGTLQIEFDEQIMKTKLILFQFGSTFGTLRFVTKSFSYTLLGFKPFGDYKPTNAIYAHSPGNHTSDKKLKFKYKGHNSFDMWCYRWFGSKWKTRANTF